MKVLGIVGSPRIKGNTQVLVEEALQAAAELGAEVELYLAAEKTIAPCDACDFCQVSRECAVGDDMQELYAKMMEADGIIFGAPVYFWNVSAQAKAIIDRTYRFRQDRELKNKVGGAIVIGRRRGLAGAMNALTAFFTIQELVLAATSTGFGDEKGDVVRREKRWTEEARRVGRTVAEVAALMQAGRASLAGQ